MKNVKVLGITLEGESLLVKLEFRYFFGFIKDVITYSKEGEGDSWFNYYTGEKLEDPELVEYLGREGDAFKKQVTHIKEQKYFDYLRESGEG